MNPQLELHDWQDALEASLPCHGDNPLIVRVYNQTASTQDIAKTFAPNRALVITDQQTAGRGRLGRQWVSAPGASVLMSLCCPIQSLGTTHDRISMLAGVAVAKAVESLLPMAGVRLKWPNDVMIEGKKLAGILIEAVNGAHVIGIGLNATHDAVGDPALLETSTSLAAHGCKADRLLVIERIVIELDRILRMQDHSLMLDDWRARAALGQVQTFEQAGQQITGTVVDLDPDQGLIIRRDTGEMITLPAATTSVVK